MKNLELLFALLNFYHEFLFFITSWVRAGVEELLDISLVWVLNQRVYLRRSWSLESHLLHLIIWYFHNHWLRQVLNYVICVLTRHMKLSGRHPSRSLDRWSFIRSHHLILSWHQILLLYSVLLLDSRASSLFLRVLLFQSREALLWFLGCISNSSVTRRWKSSFYIVSCLLSLFFVLRFKNAFLVLRLFGLFFEKR